MKMNLEWVRVVQSLVESAFQYGPFFFSIWFLYAVARWSYRNYANVLPNANVRDDERRRHWNFFVAATAFGCMLVVVSTVWWIMNRPKTYVFTGEISGFQAEDIIYSPELYLREIITTKNSDEKEIYFAAVLRDPLITGQSFRISIRRVGGELDKKMGRPPLMVRYDGHDYRRYYVALDKIIPMDGTDVMEK